MPPKKTSAPQNKITDRKKLTFKKSGFRSKKEFMAYVDKLLIFLNEFYPDAKCSLNFESPFQLLAATILSAQCTDERVNQTTVTLFAKYPDAASMAAAELEDLEKIIHPCGFYRNKSKNLLAASQEIIDKYEGVTPNILEDLIKLPGVGRKTANVVLGNAFNIPGLTVDTHLGRLSRRLGLSSNTDPEKVETDLAEIIPRERWTMFSHQVIFHGRALCRARSPLCLQCPFSACPRIGL